jgi:CarD family transcriptional regulator
MPKKKKANPKKNVKKNKSAKKSAKKVLKKKVVKKNLKAKTNNLKKNVLEKKASQPLNIKPGQHNDIVEIKKIKKQESEKRIYKVKDYVIYPKHGIGQIISILPTLM